MDEKSVLLDKKFINYEFSDIKNVIFYFDFTKQYIKKFGKNVIPEAWEIIQHTRENIAKLINAESSEIAFVKNTTEGLGIIANGLSFRSCSNVILVDQEHPANLYTWINLQKKGVEIRIIKSKDNDIFIQDIVDAIDKNTRAITISAVQFSTGIYTDLVKLGNICRENNIIFIVDGIQAIGRLNIDVKKMNINYLACGGNKGLLATLGGRICLL